MEKQGKEKKKQQVQLLQEIPTKRDSKQKGQPSIDELSSLIRTKLTELESTHSTTEDTIA